MAEFVSTTLPTYSDPLRAQSIKALEQRHKEMLAQSAAAGAITPENTQTPIQGFGHLANQLGDSFQRARVDQAAAAQRQMLAQTMAGMDLNNPKPHEIAAINSADPEMARQMLTQLAEYRRAQQAQEAAAREHALARQHSSTESSLTREQQAALAAQTDKRAREMQQEQLSATSAESGLTRQQQKELAEATDKRAREMQQEQLSATSAESGLTRQQQAALAAQTDKRAREMQQEQLSATENTAARSDERARTLQKERLEAEAALKQKELDAAAATRAADPKRNEAIKTAETEYRKGLSHIDNLEEATKILEHPNGIYTGAAQNLAPIAGGIPGVSMLVDKEKAQTHGALQHHCRRGRHPGHGDYPQGLVHQL